MDRRLLALCAAILAVPVASRTIYLEQVPPTNEEVSFMQRYGYLPSAGEGEASSFTPASITEAVRLLQGFAGLPRTGVLDGETKKLFKKKRCGVKDIEAVPSRKRRYVIQQGWNKKSISYRVLNGSSTLGKDRVDALMAKGLALWAPHVGLKFHREDIREADIEVSFASWDHGDGFPFDGLGGVMAHAFCPPYGAMHFDDDEVWGELADEDEVEDATDFFAVAVHEAGHALGMAHSAVKSSVMYPYYQPTVSRLHADDIAGMRELYSKSSASEEQTDSPVVPRSSLGPGPTQPDDDVPDLCFTNYDTIQVLQGKIYVFEEEWMWALSERKEVVEGYPKRFRDVFVGLPASVNFVRTVYERRNGNIVIFADKHYWEFGSDFRLIKRGRLSDYALPRSLPELTSAFVSNYNNKTYLISDERFWRYDEGTRAMDPGYPKEMSAWRDLPYPVDAALVWQGDTYFFRGPRFWRFDNAAIRTHRYYPLPTALVWFRCEPSADTERYIRNED